MEDKVIKLSAEQLDPIIQLVEWVDSVPAVLKERLYDSFYEGVDQVTDELLSEACPELDQYIDGSGDFYIYYKSVENDTVIITVGDSDDVTSTQFTITLVSE